MVEPGSPTTSERQPAQLLRPAPSAGNRAGPAFLRTSDGLLSHAKLREGAVQAELTRLTVELEFSEANLSGGLRRYRHPETPGWVFIANEFITSLWKWPK